MKKKFGRTNEVLHVTKTLTKAVRERSKQEIKYLWTWTNLKNRKSFAVSYTRMKKNFYSKININ